MCQSSGSIHLDVALTSLTLSSEILEKNALSDMLYIASTTRTSLTAAVSLSNAQKRASLNIMPLSNSGIRL